MPPFTKTKPIPKTKSGEIDINALIGSDRRRDAAYDRVKFSAGSTLPAQIACFQEPVSRSKSYVDTNMYLSGMFNPPSDLIFERLLLLFQPSVSEGDRNRFVAAYGWEFRILEKIIYRHPTLTCSAVGFIPSVIENFGKGSWQDPNSPPENHSLSNIHKLGEGICWDLGKDFKKYIPPLINFTFLFSGQPFELEADLDLYVFLDGLRNFAVQ